MTSIEVMTSILHMGIRLWKHMWLVQWNPVKAPVLLNSPADHSLMSETTQDLHFIWPKEKFSWVDLGGRIQAHPELAPHWAALIASLLRPGPHDRVVPLSAFWCESRSLPPLSEGCLLSFCRSHIWTTLTFKGGTENHPDNNDVWKMN